MESATLGLPLEEVVALEGTCDPMHDRTYDDRERILKRIKPSGRKSR